MSQLKDLILKNVLFSATGQLDLVIHTIGPLISEVVNDAMSKAECVSENDSGLDADVSGNISANIDSLGKEVSHST